MGKKLWHYSFFSMRDGDAAVNSGLAVFEILKLSDDLIIAILSIILHLATFYTTHAYTMQNK